MGTKQKTTKPKRGDYLKVIFEDQFAYIQYLGHHKKYGDVILVLDGGMKTTNQEQNETIPPSTGYVTFYPLSDAVSQGLAVVVVRGENAIEIPTVFRRPCNVDRKGNVLSWFIDENESTKIVEQLSLSERKIPIAGFINHEMLRFRITKNYTPEMRY